MKIQKDLLIACLYVTVTVVGLTLFVWAAASDICDRCVPVIKAAGELVDKGKEAQEDFGRILERIEKIRKSLPFEEGPGDEP